MIYRLTWGVEDSTEGSLDFDRLPDAVEHAKRSGNLTCDEVSELDERRIDENGNVPNGESPYHVTVYDGCHLTWYAIDEVLQCLVDGQWHELPRT